MLASTALTPAFAQEKKCTVLYIGGANCDVCKIWKGTDRSQWRKSPEYAAVRYVEIEPMDLRDAYVPREWKDWRWVLEKIPVHAGTPRFIVLRDRQIVSNSTSWSTTYTAIKTVVG